MAELKNISEVVKSIQAELKNSKATDKALDEKMGICIELLNQLASQTDNMSRILDEFLNINGKTAVIKKETKTKEKKEAASVSESTEPSEKPTATKTTKTKAPAKKKEKAVGGYTNILLYFKDKYKSDPTYFYSVMNEEDTNAVLATNNIDTKTNDNGSRVVKSDEANFVYKAISASGKELIRKMMAKESQKDSDSSADLTNDE